MQARYEDLAIGTFFKSDLNSAITYQKRERQGILGKVSCAYNTRTGVNEYAYGLVFPVAPMTNEEIQCEQADHQMWGRMWASHDEKVKADIQ